MPDQQIEIAKRYLLDRYGTTAGIDKIAYDEGGHLLPIIEATFKRYSDQSEDVR